MATKSETSDATEEEHAAKAKAIESLLIEKDVIADDTVDMINEFFKEEFGPMNGAKVVARAWTDDDYRELLLEDATAAMAEFDIPNGTEGEHIKVAENTPDVHNVIVCTLCSCYPMPLLGLPPYWYKDPVYRSRMIKEPREMLAEDFDTEIADDREIKVWDVSGHIRWMVLPMQPEGTEDYSEQELAELLTPEMMMGVEVPEA